MNADRLFLDANVLFSAAYREDSALARLWTLRRAELLTSAYAVEEARINLLETEQRRRLAGLSLRMRIVTEVGLLPAGISLADKDRPILQAAIGAHASHLLSGDKQHFGRYFGRRLGGVLILPPASYFPLYRRRFGTR